MNILAEQMPDRELRLGIRQVDVFAGLNVLILLLELHRYRQSRDELKDAIVFYPSGKALSDGYTTQLLKIIYYSDSSIGIGTFNQNIGFFLSGAILIGADLSGADLSSAILSDAILSDAYLSDAYLIGADLRSANLSDVRWDEFTNCGNVRRLETTIDLPAELKQHIDLQNSSS
jgi:Pentapeptide repeats (8 copies)